MGYAGGAQTEPDMLCEILPLRRILMPCVRFLAPRRSRPVGAGPVLGPVLGLLLALLAGLAAAPGALADPARISDLLRSAELFAILQHESVQYGEDLAAQMLPEADPQGWRTEVAAIYAPERLLPRYEAALQQALQRADHAAIEHWLGSDPGRRMVALELAARQKMLDPVSEEAAIARARQAGARNDPKLAAVRRLIAASDVIETNVAGGLNANLAFYRAMVEGGAFPYAVSEAEMLAEVMGQEPAIRADVTDWIEGYLFAAYAPLNLADLERGLAFVASTPGQALLRAEIAAFDLVYESSSADLGAALARRLSASAL